MNDVVFTLFYDKRWDCYLVHVNWVTDRGDYYVVTGKWTDTLSGDMLSTRQELVKTLADTIEKYDDTEIYRLFGKKRYKDERDFLQKLDEDYVKKHIKPYVERHVTAVLEDLKRFQFSIFLRKGRENTLYKKDRLVLDAGVLKPVFCFTRNEGGTLYRLRLTDGVRSYDPYGGNLLVLTQSPCSVVRDGVIFVLDPDFDGMLLLPFRTKREVVIPKSAEQEYFRKFILKQVRHADLEVEGFDVVVRQVEKRAVLSLERGVFGRMVLNLFFYYGEKQIVAGHPAISMVELKSEGDSFAFYKTERDVVWEMERGEALAGLGLQRSGAGCYIVAEQMNVSENMVHWVSGNRDLLRDAGFYITQEFSVVKYYIDDFRVENQVQEGTDWFELRTEVVMANGERIPFVSFREHILSGKEEYRLKDGSVFLIPEEWFARYSELMLFVQPRTNGLYLSRNQYPLLANFVEMASQADEWPEVMLPDEFQAILRSYQREGYEWMYRLYKKRLGGCLADDMGLGKTVQTIAMLLKYRQETVIRPKVWKNVESGVQLNLFDVMEAEEVPDEREEFKPCLIVVPASLVFNWKKELKRFAPQLRVMVYGGSERAKQRSYFSGIEVVVLTYQTLRIDIDYFARQSFGFVVLDEAQLIKNPDSQLHQAVNRLNARYWLALSGTPIENSLSDLWAIMHTVNHGVLGSASFFKAQFIKPITADLEGYKSHALESLIHPFLLRRTKEQVLSDLPERMETVLYCEPEAAQKRFYEGEKAKIRNYILEKEQEGVSLRNDFAVLQALMHLRQIANHPRLVDETYTDGSGKFDEVFRMLEEVIATGHKVLLFSGFVKFLRLIAAEVELRGWGYALLTGETTRREEVVQRFTTDPHCSVFLISLKAGGVGLNLTAADYVFILDPWWNVSAENQAIGRAHRMGQERPVFVYRFIMQGTLEEKIMAIQQQKQQLAERFITTGDVASLSAEEVKLLLG